MEPMVATTEASRRPDYPGMETTVIDVTHGNSLYSEATVQKLEQAFQIDATVPEACAYAGVSKSTYYNWLKDIQGFAGRMEAAKQLFFMKAKKAVVMGIEKNDGRLALDVLKSRQRDRYVERKELSAVIPTTLDELTAEERRIDDEIAALERGGGDALEAAEGEEDRTKESETETVAAAEESADAAPVEEG